MKKLTVTVLLAGASAASVLAQTIEITPSGARATIRGPEQAYTGAAIADVLFSANDRSQVMAVQVTFEPGARTAWHNHPAGQYLIVTSGVGWVQQRGGAKREIRPGDVVWTPPGVAHWHGATPVNAMSHLAVWEFVDDSGGELMEHVSDEDYLAEPARSAVRPEDTEVWQPVPPVITAVSDAIGRPPPTAAIALFDGRSLDEWVNTRDGGPAGWIVSDGVLIVDKTAGNIETRRRFRNYELHLEWRVPEDITGAGQARGNSGLFLASTGRGDRGYELQILDSYANATYVNGMAGSIYKQSIPLANASRKPGEWQAFDVVWTAPTFSSDGALRTPARVTAFLNGVLVQDDFELRGETVYIGAPSYAAHGDSPIKLQAQGDPSAPLSFRNVWVRTLP